MSKDRKGAVQTHGNLVQMKNCSRGTPDLRIASPKGFSVPEDFNTRRERTNWPTHRRSTLYQSVCTLPTWTLAENQASQCFTHLDSCLYPLYGPALYFRIHPSPHPNPAPGQSALYTNKRLMHAPSTGIESPLLNVTVRDTSIVQS